MQITALSGKNAQLSGAGSNESGAGRILLLRIGVLGLESLADYIGHHPRSSAVQVAVTVDRRLNAFVAEVSLNHWEWHTCLDQPGGVGVAQVVHPGFLRQTRFLCSD